MSDTNLPAEFSLADLQSILEPEEIAALAKATEDDAPVIVIDDAAGQEAPADPLAEGVGQPPTDPQSPAPAQLQAPLVPPVEIPDTTEAQQVINALDSKLESLSDAFDNGEITRAELVAQTKTLIAEQAKAQALIDQAAQAVTQVKKTAEQIFYAAQDAYYKAGAADLVSDTHIKAWDRHLREVTGNPALQSLTADQLIRLAHTRYAAEYEVINGKPLGIKVPGVTPAADKLERRTDPRPDAPQTLANVNGDIGEAISDSRFAQVDSVSRVDPLAAEQLMARMSPDELERYLQTA